VMSELSLACGSTIGITSKSALFERGGLVCGEILG